MRFIIASLIVLLALGVQAQTDNPTIREFEAEKLYFQGRQYYQRGDFNSAIAFFNQVLTLDQDHPEVYELRAEAFFQLENYRQAFEDYRTALQLEPNNAELYNSAGVAAAQLNQYGVAISYFEQALIVQPNHAGAKRNLAAAKERYKGGPLAINGPGRNQPDDDVFDPNKLVPTMSIMELDAWPLDGKPSSGSSIPQQTQVQRWEFAGGKTYRFLAKQIHIGAQSDPYVKLGRVIISKNETEVSMTVHNFSNEEYPLQLARRGDATFYLTDQAYSKVYRLKDVRGLREWRSGKTYTMRPNERKTFALIFDPLLPEANQLHLLEGTLPREGSWNFWNITFEN